MSQPLVSIIMGVYNNADTIDDCIQSILEQTYTNWEFVICDDGSSDHTYEHLLRYQKAYPDKFVLLKNHINLKLPATLNKCLDVAKGEYIARMDGDDVSLPSRFQEQVVFLQGNPQYDIVGTSVTLFDGHGEKGMRRLSGEVQSKVLLTGVPFVHPTVMMRANVFHALGGYQDSKLVQEARAEDYELWCRLFAQGSRGYNLEQPLFSYREDLSTNGKKSIKRMIPRLKLTYRCYQVLGIPKWQYIYLSKCILSHLLPHRVIYQYHKVSGKTVKLK